MSQIKTIYKWWGKFDNKEIIIKTKNNIFKIKITKTSLPHLLGLQYAVRARVQARPRTLIHMLVNKSDREIYSLINTYNPKQLKLVKKRIKHFRNFMENIDNMTLVEQTHPNTKMKSNYLLIETLGVEYSHLGLALKKNTDYFETFFIHPNKSYFSNTSINEKVLSLEEKVDDKLIPFSFKQQ